MPVSDLGWQSIDKPNAFRVGPHVPNSTSPRLIGFRDNDVADILATSMWLLRTGNGGKYPDIRINNWHGHRDKNAPFGARNSDHHAGVADDKNGAKHPWEVAVGVSAYEAHMANPALKLEHECMASVEKRLTPPGALPVARWCGIPWRTDMGWTAYARGYRDCMHWVIGTTNRARISAAAKHVRSFFVPPRTVEDIKNIQKRIGVAADGDYQDKSIAAMRKEQKRLGVPATGLPGDVATRKAWAKEDATSKPSPAPAPPPRKPSEAVKNLQRKINAFYGKNVVAVDGFRGDETNGAINDISKAMGVKLTGLSVTNITKNLEAFMATLDELKTQMDRIEKQVKANKPPTAKAIATEAAKAVWGYVYEGHGPFNAFWWLRRGAVLNRTHKNFPADPGSPADVERKVAAKVLGKEIPPYTG